MSGKQELWRQYVAAFIANLGMFSFGILILYASPISPILLYGDDSLRITEEENSWFTSTLSIGAMIGSLIVHIFLERWGRKGTLLLSGVPLIVGWCFLLGAQNLAMLLVGRVLHGFVLAFMLTTIPPYIGEIADVSIRGRLSGAFGVAISLGFIYILGISAFLKNFRWLTAIGLIPAFPFLIGVYIFLPESPVHLRRKNREEDTKQSLRRLNGKRCNIDDILATIDSVIERYESNKTGLDLKSFTKKEVYKPFFIIFILIVMLHLGGFFSILFNLFLVFQSVGVDVSSDLCSIITAFIYLAATASSAALLDKLGRKVLMLISFGSGGVGLVFLGLFFYLVDLDEWKEWTYSSLWWMPIISILLYIFSIAFAGSTVPFILIGEYFPPNVRSICSGLLCGTAWGLGFLISLTFAQTKAAMGVPGAYGFYSIFNFIGFFFTAWAVLETKGRSFIEITNYFKSGTFSPKEYSEQLSEIRQNTP